MNSILFLASLLLFIALGNGDQAEVAKQIKETLAGCQSEVGIDGGKLQAFLISGVLDPAEEKCLAECFMKKVNWVVDGELNNEAAKKDLETLYQNDATHKVNVIKLWDKCVDKVGSTPASCEKWFSLAKCGLDENRSVPPDQAVPPFGSMLGR